MIQFTLVKQIVVCYRRRFFTILSSFIVFVYCLSVVSCTDELELFVGDSYSPVCDMADTLRYYAGDKDVTLSLPITLNRLTDKIQMTKEDSLVVNNHVFCLSTMFGEWYSPGLVLLTHQRMELVSDLKKYPVPGCYVPSLNSIFFNFDFSISTQTVAEELIHAGQDRIYPGGINQYAKAKGGSNIEFEAKLFQDVVNCLNDLNFNLGVGKNNNDEYVRWVMELCESGNNDGEITTGLVDLSFPSMEAVLSIKMNEVGYYGMMKAFALSKLEYNMPISTTLKPLFINFTYNTIK